MSRIYGQSTKESYRDDIELSRKTKTVYKIFEWLDDHSYCSSDKLGIYLCVDDEDTFLYLFQEDGPKKIETLKKFLEWRRSGESTELGHKGGGNKRNIYGHHCDDVNILMRLDDKNVLRCGAKPNKIYELSKSDIDEGTFRRECDSSTYLTNPETIKVKNLPSWYDKIYHKIKEESDISPNFLIRLELTDIPDEYNTINNWNEYINQIRTKQYDICIKYKNELLNILNYETYENIDMIGYNDVNKINNITIKLYYSSIKKSFYLMFDGQYINVKDKKEEKDVSNILEWGEIQMFIVNTSYASTELKKYNMNNENTKRLEDFYGVYLKLNDKLTNYLPFEGKILGDSRNNGINSEVGVSNNSRFRMIITPHSENCKNSEIFDSLIQTREIKALTGFLENSPYKEITSLAIKLYKGESYIKQPKQKQKKVVKKNKIKEGGIYIGYLNNGLWKYGMVCDYNNMDDRITRHKNDCIKTIESFIDVLDNKEIPKHNNFTVIWKKKINLPRGGEEKLMKLIEEYKKDKIRLLKSNRSENEQREYFICNDFNYIYNDILNIIIETFE